MNSYMRTSAVYIYSISFDFYIHLRSFETITLMYFSMVVYTNYWYPQFLFFKSYNCWYPFFYVSRYYHVQSLFFIILYRATGLRDISLRSDTITSNVVSIAMGRGISRRNDVIVKAYGQERSLQEYIKKKRVPKHIP